jgi:hypothetical protein
LSDEGVKLTEDFAIEVAKQVRFWRSFPHNTPAEPQSVPTYDTPIQLLQLTADFSVATGDVEYSAKGKPVWFLPSTNKYTKDDNAIEQKIYYPIVARDNSGNPTAPPGVKNGAWVWCIFRGRWEVLSSQGGARMLIGSGPNSTVAANASYTFTPVRALDGGTLPTGTITVTNYSSGLPANASPVVVVSDGQGGWRTLDGPCG